MRTGISNTLSGTDRGRLERIASDRNSLQRHVWRADPDAIIAARTRRFQALSDTATFKAGI
jgi:hypothetical protein